MMDLNKLKALAAAASPGPWRGDRIDGTVKYSLLDATGNPVISGDNGNSDAGPFGIHDEEDEKYLMAAHPAAVLELIALTERIQAELTAKHAAKAQGALAASVDQAALDAATAIVALPRPVYMPGGNTQYAAKVQCLVVDAIEAAAVAPSIQALPACPTCDDHGSVGNPTNAEPCPECSYGNELPEPQRSAFRQGYEVAKKQFQALPVVAPEIDLTGTNIPQGDARGSVLDQLYAAFHREPAGDTLHAIGSAIQTLQATTEWPMSLRIVEAANEHLTTSDYIWQGNIDQITAFAGAVALAAAQPEAKEAPAALSDEQVRSIFLANGFTIKEGQTDLKPYVYAAASALLTAAGNSQDAKDAAWLPIETAPKNGTEVLLYLPSPFDRIAKATWFEPWGNWIEGDTPDPSRDEYCGIGSALPTHYMRLPAAPMAAAPSPAEPT